TSDPQILKFGDWVVVEDGLVFGNNGVSSTTRELEVTAWDETISNIIDYGFSVEEDYLDLTDQVLLGGETSSVGFLGDLVHSSDSENNSFKVSGFPGVPITNVYSELMNAYQLKQIRNSEMFELQDGSDLSANPCEGTTEYCVISSEGDITIPSGFVCSRKTLITSAGNIYITPDFTNEDSSDACILLANGDINIEDGLSGTEDVHYDVIQALLIAGNNIVIEEDTSGDGLIVEGGLIAFGSEDTGISNIIDNRTISWGYRNSYPVIAVNNSAKYGLISKDIFGSQVEIFKLEIGFKPY
ncbi:MAG: hypothetical protein PHP08_02450, partial [Candidatus Dojkabacteria bacterium]|nr:hypothetical protein [Candidatus Dojkabacteria bacterium]